MIQKIIENAVAIGEANPICNIVTPGILLIKYEIGIRKINAARIP